MDVLQEAVDAIEVVERGVVFEEELRNVFQVQFTPKLGARIVKKVLKSAVSNALHEGKVRAEDLYVKEAVVGAGPTLKRWLPRAQGRATPLLKRTSHVSVTVATRES